MASAQPAAGEQELISLQIRTLATGNHDVTVAPGVRDQRKGSGADQDTRPAGAFCSAATLALQHEGGLLLACLAVRVRSFRAQEALCSECH